MQYKVIKRFPTPARTFQLHSLLFHFELSNFSFLPTALFNNMYFPLVDQKWRINVTDSTYIESTDFGNKIEPEVLIK